MPVAAVPGYLGTDFKSASPGMRFGLYLPIWTDRSDQEQEVNKRAQAKSREGREVVEMLRNHGMEATIAALRQRKYRPLPGLWKKNDLAARQAWRRTTDLNPEDRERMAALSKRQNALAATLASDRLLILDAKSIAPFTTGLGNEHPLENGFAFLWPYGLPYLPGSGVKGVLRQAARELAGVSEQARWEMESDWTVDIITALFGSEESDNPQRGALSFWDVLPEIWGDRLMVEIMTPHQTHYYQNGEAPHDSGQPNPIPFLTVPPGSGFTFHVVCDLPFLRRVAPELAGDERWKALLREAIAHAFDWLGFGAKTAVGYGAMAIDIAAEREREEVAEAAAFAQLTPEEQQIEKLREVFEEEQKKNMLAANGQTADLRMQLLEAACSWDDIQLKKKAAEQIKATLKFLPWSKNAKKKKGVIDKMKQLEGSE